MKAELLARLLAVAGIVVPLAGVGVVLAPRLSSGGEAIEIHARVAEEGGWQPSELVVAAGAPIRLRLTSDDVVHGFAVGQSDIQAVEILPGQYTELTVTFDRPGRYAYYCTRWCGAGHWRMRGTIEVVGGELPSTAPQEPLYVALGLDIDAPHLAPEAPGRRPSSVAGAALGVEPPAEMTGRGYYESHTPVQAIESLRAEASLSWMDDQEMWDLVALLWRRNTTAETLETGRELFAQNCAACHGEAGGGDGVMAGSLLTLADGPSATEAPQPADFTSLRSMLGASPALLQGKILRGGMGTGMPYFGPILTEAQIWSLVDYLWTFTMEYEE